MNISSRFILACRSAAINRELPDQLARRIAQAIGWGIVVYAIIFFAFASFVIVEIIQEFVFGIPQGITPYRYLRFAAHSTLGLIFLLGGIITIKIPRLLFPVSVLLTALLALYSTWSFYGGLGYSVDSGASHLLSWLILCFHDPITGLFIAGALYSMRRRSEVGQGLVSCQYCGYDLRGTSTLDCSECGHHYAPHEFYQLRRTNVIGLTRVLGFAAIGLGLADLGSRIDFIIEGSRYLIIHSFDDSAELYEMVHWPSMEATYTQIVEGAILIICGLIGIRWPKRAVQAFAVSLSAASVSGWIEYLGTVRELHDLADVPHRIGWFLGSFRPAIVGLAMLAALFPLRRSFRLLTEQSPICAGCGCDLRHTEDLCCVQCGRQYTPYEFYQL